MKKMKRVIYSLLLPLCFISNAPAENPLSGIILHLNDGQTVIAGLTEPLEFQSQNIIFNGTSYHLSQVRKISFDLSGVSVKPARHQAFKEFRAINGQLIKFNFEKNVSLNISLVNLLGQNLGDMWSGSVQAGNFSYNYFSNLPPGTSFSNSVNFLKILIDGKPSYLPIHPLIQLQNDN